MSALPLDVYVAATSSSMFSSKAFTSPQADFCCEKLKPGPNSVVLPSWVVTAIAHVPNGARPSYAQGFYLRDDVFYRQWDAISKDRQKFLGWKRQYVEHD